MEKKKRGRGRGRDEKETKAAFRLSRSFDVQYALH